MKETNKNIKESLDKDSRNLKKITLKSMLMLMRPRFNISAFSHDPKRMEKITGATKLEMESVYINYYDKYPTLERNSTVGPTLESVSKYEK